MALQAKPLPVVLAYFWGSISSLSCFTSNPACCKCSKKAAYEEQSACALITMWETDGILGSWLGPDPALVCRRAASLSPYLFILI